MASSPVTETSTRTKLEFPEVNLTTEQLIYFCFISVTMSLTSSSSSASVDQMSLNQIHGLAPAEQPQAHLSRSSRFLKRLQHVQKTWAPLMAAKEHLDDDYNFPSGRFAGQGCPPTNRSW